MNLKLGPYVIWTDGWIPTNHMVSHPQRQNSSNHPYKDLISEIILIIFLHPIFSWKVFHMIWLNGSIWSTLATTEIALWTASDFIWFHLVYVAVNYSPTILRQQNMDGSRTPAPVLPFPTPAPLLHARLTLLPWTWMQQVPCISRLNDYMASHNRWL
jgi:hypothetical protein